MEASTSKMQLAADTIIAAIRERNSNGKIPLLVVLDGGSGAGKSTLALLIARELNATIIHVDDFYAAQISNAEWEVHSAEQRAADAVDWRRLNPSSPGNLRSIMPLILKGYTPMAHTLCVLTLLSFNLLKSSYSMAHIRRDQN